MTNVIAIEDHQALACWSRFGAERHF